MDKIEFIHTVMMLGADTYNKTHTDRYEAQLKAEKLLDDYIQQVKKLNIPAVSNRRELLIDFCDKVVWKDNREHIHTDRIDKYLKEGN